jgi:DHA2 family multidrug resistance protein
MARPPGPPPELPRSAAGPYNPWLIAVVVSIATFMEILDTTIANVSLRHIAGALGASSDESTYILTSYLVSNAIVLPISGWLSNVIGRKRFYMLCVALFTISSALCAFSTSLEMMIAFRVLQGIGGGGLAPTEQSIFADSFTPAKRAMAFTLYGFTIVTAPAIGPALGGYITDNLSWHWVFLINVPVGIVSLMLTSIFVSDSATTKADRRALFARGLKIDYLGFALVVIGFGALQILLDRFEREDGFSSPFIVALTVLTAIGLGALIVWELIHPQPIVNLRLLKSRGFAISNVVLFLFGFMIMASTQLTPQMTQELMGYDATHAGESLAFGALMTLLLMPFAGMITGRLVQPRWLIFGGLTGIAGALYYASTLYLTMSFETVALSRLLLVMWMPFIFIPLTAVQYIGIPPDKNNDASAMLSLVRNIGGSVGVAVATNEMAWRTQFHHARLAEHVSVFNRLDVGQTLRSLAERVQTQATMMSYLDVFTILAGVAVCVAPLALLLPKAPKRAAMGH